jgi:hypothetical protein
VTYALANIVLPLLGPIFVAAFTAIYGHPIAPYWWTELLPVWWTCTSSRRCAPFEFHRAGILDD